MLKSQGLALAPKLCTMLQFPKGLLVHLYFLFCIFFIFDSSTLLEAGKYVIYLLLIFPFTLHMLIDMVLVTQLDLLFLLNQHNHIFIYNSRINLRSAVILRHVA
jgi:hypothetical protein